jgi:hypothetical protein
VPCAHLGSAAPRPRSVSRRIPPCPLDRQPGQNPSRGSAVWTGVRGGVPGPASLGRRHPPSLTVPRYAWAASSRAETTARRSGGPSKPRRVVQSRRSCPSSSTPEERRRKRVRCDDPAVRRGVRGGLPGPASHGRHHPPSLTMPR